MEVNPPANVLVSRWYHGTDLCVVRASGIEELPAALVYIPSGCSLCVCLRNSGCFR